MARSAFVLTGCALVAAGIYYWPDLEPGLRELWQHVARFAALALLFR